MHLKRDCISGSILNGLRQPILYSFALEKPPGHEIYDELKTKLFKTINMSALAHIRFYLEKVDLKPVDFSRETITFTHQLIEI